MKKFLLYGANGYTAGLIIQYAQDFGLIPIVAGRTASKIEPIAKTHGLESRVFSLDNAAEVEKGLDGVNVVLHCAGPFKYTAKPMMEACLNTGTHYLDITGEMEIFELGNQLDSRAKEQGIMIMPGTGFDVVPTDCLASYLKNQLPDATHLELGIASDGGGVSRGTAKTVVENLGEPGAIREDGKIIPVRAAFKTRRIPFDDKTLLGVTIPWGDVSTAYHNTGIPNILVYMAANKKMVRSMKMQNYFGWLLGTNMVKNFLRKKVDQRKPGPGEAKRKKARSLIWGEVKNKKGATKTANIVGPEGYTLTALTALLITKKVIDGDYKTGFQTPGKAYGQDLILEIEGTRRIDL